MKFHYIHILFFLSLNILLLSSEVYNQRNHYITRTPKTNTRTLCECELYAPSNYDNDSQMKEVMQDFDRQTSQRFEEYNERMMKNRQKCKEQCEKDIQKIILKDKIEKELTEKFSKLQTDISTDDIPTCVCEKSLADKVEKGCLRCGYGLGTVAPTVGLIGAVAVHQWTNAALLDAAQKGIQAGIAKAIDVLKLKFDLETLYGFSAQKIITAKTFNKPMFFVNGVMKKYNAMCATDLPGKTSVLCSYKVFIAEESKASLAVAQNARTIATKAGEEAAKITSQEITAVNMASYNLYTSIAYSVVAILVIILVMVIIYLILHYRRKKKMKKKLQYIKLLKE
ncbi:hypothetical protein PFFVO_03258 [Plasmodium falciparum Vietnam Oak-Knoll (FVO)]|uniref:Surface antigen n=1 Tax=Plasmodium falciparum Vietnam Oak-Knoll (FVO) TaxID=1036723 RepID=A0A024V4S5_PLAFA|nr:hypothetical protein PFFVO_03258 [Plasmodium falciparum Vietnam Oak-Knoll (FVO)]